MFEKDKWIPAVAFAVFAVAAIGILWGDRIGWDALIYQVPQPLYSIVGIAALILVPLIFLRMNRSTPGDPARSLRTNWSMWLMLAGVVALVLALIFIHP
jgi:hypothetical protein